MPNHLQAIALQSPPQLSQLVSHNRNAVVILSAIVDCHPEHHSLTVILNAIR